MNNDLSLNNSIKYLLFIAISGFNDNLVQLEKVINFCNIEKRVLLIDYSNSDYKINFDEYFGINTNKCKVICNKKYINTILENYNEKIYPLYFSDKIKDIINNKLNLKNIQLYYNGVTSLDNVKNIDSELLIYCRGAGGSGFSSFKNNIVIKQNLKIYCYLKKINEKYLYIQIRNTDIKCNYKKLYLKNKNLINKYNIVYIATDDYESICFFRKHNINVINYSIFPNESYRNLHQTSKISPDDKIKSLICDLYMVLFSDKILTISKGGFIELIKNCFKNKDIIKQKFKLD